MKIYLVKAYELYSYLSSFFLFPLFKFWSTVFKTVTYPEGLAELGLE